MKRVLIAADDAHARAWIEGALDSLDVAHEICATGALGERLSADPADLTIVDAGRSTETVVQTAERAAARGAEVRLLLAVEADALETLRMPVHFPADFVVRGSGGAEVSARVRGLLWPGEEVGGQDVVRIDGLTLNLATFQAALHGEPIEFTYLEYALFVFLVTHPNRVYGREALLNRVWGTDYYGGARTVDVHVRRIRAKLGPEVSHRLETVRNVGYLWRS